jgi:hypothetical protein
MERLRIRDGVTATVFADSAVILDCNKNKYYALNRTGSMLWSLLQRGVSERDAAEQTVKTFGSPPENVGEDIHVFVERLQALGLVERSCSPHGSTE